MRKTKNYLEDRYTKQLEVEFLPEALEIVEEPSSPMGHFSIWSIISITAFFFVWAFLGKMDEVATAQAYVIPEEGLKVIQPLYEGTIKEIFVTEGSVVKKGDPVVTLDTSMEDIVYASASYQHALLSFQNSMLARIARHEDIGDYARENDVTEENYLQVIELYQLMKEEYDLQEKQIGSVIIQSEAQLQIEQTVADKAEKKLKVLQEQKNVIDKLYAGTGIEEATLDSMTPEISVLSKEVDCYKKLYEQDAITKNELESKERELNNAKYQYAVQQARTTYEESNKNLDAGDIVAQIEQATKDWEAQATVLHQRSEQLEQQKKSLEELKSEYDKNISAMIVENQSQMESLQKDIDTEELYQGAQTLAAPIDGTIQSLTVNTIGGVVARGDVVAAVVPQNAHLIAEASILNQDIGVVEVGQRVAIKVNAFSFQKYGTIGGTITQISPTAVMDENIGYIYKAKIELDSTEFMVDGKTVPIISGMTGSAEIKLREKRVIEILVEPLVEHFDGSLSVR